MARIKEKNPTTAITTVRSKFRKFPIHKSMYCQILPCDKLGSKVPFASTQYLKLSQISAKSFKTVKKIWELNLHHHLLAFSVPGCCFCTVYALFIATLTTSWSVLYVQLLFFGRILRFCEKSRLMFNFTKQSMQDYKIAHTFRFSVN